MLIFKIIRIFLLVQIFVFCLHLNLLNAEDPCKPNFSTLKKKWERNKFEWVEYNPQEITPNTIADLFIANGKPPYEWEVSGEDFLLKETKTRQLNNELIALDTSCGTATIFVTDNTGQTVLGYIRSTHGEWVEVTPATCEIPGDQTSFDGKWIERIEGAYKQRQWYEVVWASSGGYYQDGQDCQEHCYLACPSSQSEECITYEGKFTRPPYFGEFPFFTHCCEWNSEHAGYHYHSVCIGNHMFKLYRWECVE